MTDLRTTRRRAVAGALAAGAAAAIPEDALAAKRKKAPKRRARKADVVIVGAGLAGLTAARELTRAGKSVIVLEARNRPGGRVKNADLGGGRISERGGTFVGPTQDRVIGLGADYGVGTFPTYDTGSNVYLANGQRSTFASDGITGSAPSDPLLLPDLAVNIAKLDELAAKVPVDAPWTAPDAAANDAITFQTWVDQNAINPAFKALASVACRPIFGSEPRELSLLYVLWYIATAGDERTVGTFERNFNTKGGAQEQRFVGGAYAIVRKMTAELGKRVVYKSPVRRIRQTASGVTVTSDKAVVKAKRVIVAVPPTLAARIDFRPDLPPDHDALLQRVPQGRLLKVAAVYEKPWWRDEGLTGQSLSTDTHINATFDDSPEDGSLGVVFGFIGGDSARDFARRSDADRRSTYLSDLSRLLGPQAGNPVKYFETNWTQETWSRGCPVGTYGPGTMTNYGDQIRRIEGRIHWAGTETSTYWNGYMEGAVRSGIRAAAEVLGA